MSRCHKIVMSRCPMSKCITTVRQQRIHKTKDLNRAVLFPFTSPAPQSTSFYFQRYATAIFLPHFSWEPLSGARAHKVVTDPRRPLTSSLNASCIKKKGKVFLQKFQSIFHDLKLFLKIKSWKSFFPGSICQIQSLTNEIYL